MIEKRRPPVGEQTAVKRPHVVTTRLSKAELAAWRKLVNRRKGSMSQQNRELILDEIARDEARRKRG